MQALLTPPRGDPAPAEACLACYPVLQLHCPISSSTSMLRLPAPSRETTVEERKGVSFLVYFLFVHKNGKLGLDLGEPLPFLELRAGTGLQAAAPLFVHRPSLPAPSRAGPSASPSRPSTHPHRRPLPITPGPILKLDSTFRSTGPPWSWAGSQTRLSLPPTQLQLERRGPHLAAQSQSHRSTPRG